MIPKEALSNPSDFLFMNEKGEIYTRDEDGSLQLIELDQFGRKWTKKQGEKILVPG
jgi:hypothetical protein